MSIDACIAHAIHSDLDILEVLPELKEMPVEQLELYIEQYIIKVQQEMRVVISEKGQKFLRSNDAAGLCATCLEAGMNLPPKTLLKMCRTILQLSAVDARFILDTDDGTSLFYMKVKVNAIEEQGRRKAA